MYEDKPEPPRVDELGFDHRLITPQRLLALAGGQRIRLRFDDRDGCDLVLECVTCDRQVTSLTDAIGVSASITPQQILQDTLRHQVTHHGQALNATSSDRWSELVEMLHALHKELDAAAEVLTLNLFVAVGEELLAYGTFRGRPEVQRVVVTDIEQVAEAFDGLSGTAIVNATIDETPA